MGDLCSERDPQFEVGFLSKQREEWVLITHVREGKKLRGYSFCTLERIGGTPVAARWAWPRSTARPRQTRPAPSDGRPVPKGACWPSPTRTSSSGPGSPLLRGSGPSSGCQTWCRGRGTRPRVRRGRGRGVSPSGSEQRPASTTGPSCLPATAPRPGRSTTEARRSSPPPGRGARAARRDGQRDAETASSCSAGPWPRTSRRDGSPPAETATDANRPAKAGAAAGHDQGAKRARSGLG